MNTNPLCTALSSIIAAVDSLPDKSSRHFPKSVLDAVEDGRKALVEDGQICDAEDAAFINAMSGCVLRRVEACNSPRRIYAKLVGGPLDGCYYLRTFTEYECKRGRVLFIFQETGKWGNCHDYTTPDRYGQCRYIP